MHQGTKRSYGTFFVLLKILVPFYVTRQDKINDVLPFNQTVAEKLQQSPATMTNPPIVLLTHCPAGLPYAQFHDFGFFQPAWLETFEFGLFLKCCLSLFFFLYLHFPVTSFSF